MVVRVDLEWHDAEGLERGGEDDRHVVSRHHRGARRVRARAHAQVGHALGHPLPDRIQEARLVQGADQEERVPPADVYPVCLPHGRPCVLARVDAHQLRPLPPEESLHPGRVGLWVVRGVGDEEDLLAIGEVRAYQGPVGLPPVLGRDAPASQEDPRRHVGS